VLSDHAFRAIIVVGRDRPDEAAYLNSFCCLSLFAAADVKISVGRC
jgi:hypothetical protein